MENRKKRLLALLLAFVLAFGMVTPGFAADGGGAWDGAGLPVTTTSPAALTITPSYYTIAPALITTALDFTNPATPSSGDGYIWNAATNTLTLNGITLNVAVGPAIILPAGAEVVLAGNNTITNTATAFVSGKGIRVPDGNLSISGNGVLEISTNSVCVYVVNGSLTINGGNLDVVSSSNLGILATTMVINPGAEVNIEASTQGINVPGNVTINGGTLTIEADWGIATSGGNSVTVNGGTVTINAITIGINANGVGANITINSGVVTIDAGQHGLNAPNGTTTITGGTVEIDAGGNGLNPPGNATITDGNVIINGVPQRIVTFNLSGGTFAGNTNNVIRHVPNGTPVAVPSPITPPAGYTTPVTWQSSVGGMTLSNITGNVTFTAQWTPTATIVTETNIILPPPVTGVEPVRTLTPTHGQWTAVVEWRTRADNITFSGNAFEANTAYDAWITLTALQGYTFEGFGNFGGVFSVNGSTNTAGNPATRLVVYASFLATAQATLANAIVTISGTYTFTNQPQVPTPANVTVTLNGTNLVHGTDFTFTASNNVNANQVDGPAVVTVQGIGNFTGTATGNFDIAQRPLAGNNIALMNPPWVYTGSQITPDLFDMEIWLENPPPNLVVVWPASVTVSYGENINAGTNAGSITLTAIPTSNFTGSASRTFNIAQATVAGVARTADAEIGESTNITLSGLLPTLTAPMQFGTISYSIGAITGNIANINVTESGGVLTVSVPAVATDGQAAVIPITVTSQNFTTFTFDLTVTASYTATAVIGVSIDQSNFTLQATQANQLTATVAPNNATNTSITWGSSDSAIVTVNATGLVTAVAPGTAIITVTTVDGGFTDTVQVTVVSVPDAPTGVTAIAGNEQATVSFTPPTNDGNSPITSFTVTSNPGGFTATGTTSPITITGLTNGTVYTFTITATNAIGTSVASAPSASVTPMADTRPLTVNLNGGTGGATFAADIPQTAWTIAPTTPIPTLTGHTFGGWALTDGGAPIVVVPAGTTAVTLHALWTPNTYTITYNLNGGTLPIGAWNSYTFGTGLTLPIPTRANHNFGGWFDNAGLTGTVIAAISTTDTGNREFWAAWNPIAVTGVTLNPTNATILTGQTQTLTAIVAPADALNQAVTWQSSDTTVATVTNGIVTAVSAGTAIITVTTADGNLTATATITATDAAVAVTGVSLNTTATTLIVGDTETLIATITPATATNQNVTWQSSNPAVATVLGGVVTAVSAGTATTTVTTADGSFTATATITVNPITYTVTFVLNNGTRTGGGDLVQTIVSGGNAILPTVTHAGYDFVNWTPVGAYNNITSDRTITAQWTAATCAHPTTSTTTTPATCTTAGATVVTCDDCGTVISTTLIPALGHTWGAWITTTHPTATTTGIQTRTCATCNITETRSVPATGNQDGDHQGGDRDSSPTSAWLSPNRANFDLANPQDIAVTINRGDFTFRNNVRFGNVQLERDRDFTVNGNRITISADFLSTLEVGQRRLTFEMSGGTTPQLTITVVDTTPAPQPTPAPDQDTAPPATSTTVEIHIREEELIALMEQQQGVVIEEDGITIIIPDELLRSLIDMDNLQDVTLRLNVEQGDMEAGTLLAVDLSIIVGDTIVEQTAVPFTVAVSMEGINLDGINTYRLVAVDENGEILGGRYNRQTGLFIFEAQGSGTFAITYVETLNRLTLQLDSPVIFDLAENAPTQHMDVLPIIQNGRTLIPVRFVAEALGTEVNWTQSTEGRPLTVFLTLDGQTLSFAIGEATPELATLGMDVPAQLADGRTMVPLRFISEFFGAVVTWDAETRSIEIISNQATR